MSGAAPDLCLVTQFAKNRQPSQLTLNTKFRLFRLFRLFSKLPMVCPELEFPKTDQAPIIFSSKKKLFTVYHNYIKNNRILLEYRIEFYYKINNIYKYKIQYHESKFLRQQHLIKNGWQQ